MHTESKFYINLFCVFIMFKFIAKHVLSSGKNHSKPFDLNFSTTKIHGANDSKYVISGRPLDPVVGVTVTEYIFAERSKYENQPAFTCGVTKRAYTFKQVYGMTFGFAAALKQHGIKKGDVVGIMLPNMPEYPILEFATWLIGGIVSPISSAFTPDEVGRQCQIADVKIIVTMPIFLPLIKEIQAKLPMIQSIVNIGLDSVDGTHSFFEMARVNPQGVEFCKGSEIDTKNDIAMLPFSSGTTGPPKACMLTHSNICSNIEQYCQKEIYVGKSNECLIGILPFYHCYGSGSLIFTSMKKGSQVVTLPKFIPTAFIELMRTYKSPEIRKAEFKSVHTIACGAAPVGKAVIMGLLKKADKEIFFQEGYGMTEMTTCATVSTLKRQNTKLGSIGEVLPGVKCKVVDPDTGQPVPSNTRGELWFQGPQIMKGYFKNEKATSETLTSDGWLKTGDIAIYDDDKCFYIVDRMKELIKVKGLQVSPSELEDLLRTNTEIADVAIVGIPHERFGEAPRAYIVKRSEKLTEGRVHDFLEQKIAPHKKLSGGIEFVNQIPRANSGKILRRILLQDYKAGGNKP